VTIPKGVTSSKLTNIASTLYDYLTLINIVYVCTVTVITNNPTVSHSNLHRHCLENFKVCHIFIMISYNKMSVHIAALLHYEISVQVLSAYLHQKFQIILILSTFFCHEISVYLLPISLHHEVSSYFT
jgi:hypothetical protein